MDKKWIGIIFLVIFAFGSIVYKVKNDYKTNETFSNKNNILNNSSFNSGKNIAEYTNAVGTNEIIIYPNTGASSYVLRQSGNENNKREEIYYNISLKLKPQTLYKLSCLYFDSDSNNELIHKIKFGDKTYYLRTGEEGVSQLNQFGLYNTYFKTPVSNNQIETTISLSYNLSYFEGYKYLTDISLSEELQDSDLPIINTLQLYLNYKNKNSLNKNSKTWKDLSSNGNDAMFTLIPKVDENNGIVLDKKKLILPSGFHLANSNKIASNNSFTMFLFVKGNNIINKKLIRSRKNSKLKNGNMLLSESEYEEEDNNSIDYINLLQIPGNNKNSLLVKVPKNYGEIVLDLGDKKIQSNLSIMTNQENLFCFNYNGSTFNLFLNGELMLTDKVDKLYFNNNKILVNPNKDFNGNIYSIAFYNSSLKNRDIAVVNNYLIKNKNSTVNSDVLDINITDFMLEYLPNNARPNLISAEEMEEELEDRTNCPKVIFKNKHYYIDIPKNSELAKNLGYYGIKDYGIKREVAKEIYEVNFPGCTVPDILDKNKYKPDLSNCPFILHNSNPCNFYECKDVNWNPNIKNNSKSGNNFYSNMNKQCKQRIDNYCQINKGIDPSCYCWEDKNWNKLECKKWRGIFEPPDKCDFHKYSIEEHPDSKDYIRKDSIPCWNCNLDAPGFKESAELKKCGGN